MGSGAESTAVTVELSVSEQEHLGSLIRWLNGSGISVQRSTGVPGPGEQGVMDFVTLIADSSVLGALVQVLPEFIKSKRSLAPAPLSVAVKIKGKSFTVTGSNADEVGAMVDKLLNA